MKTRALAATGRMVAVVAVVMMMVMVMMQAHKANFPCRQKLAEETSHCDVLQEWRTKTRFWGYALQT